MNGDAASMYVEDLRFKINLFRAAFRIASDADFATDIGVKPSTLSDYMRDGDNGRDDVPNDRIDVMAKVLVDRLSGKITVEHARLAWLADLQSFQLAIAPHPSSMFGALLDATPRTVPIALKLRARRGMHDDEPLPLDPSIRRLPAQASFKLEVKATRGAFLIILAQSLLGWHLAVPRTPEPIKIGSSGSALVPPTGLKFSKEGGRYVFYAFAIQSAYVPSLILRAEEPSPLTDDERNAFAGELKDRLRTRRFALGRLDVFVEPAA